MNSVLLSKYLFETAERTFSQADPFTYGLTTSLLQDSAEMLIWEMAKKFKVKSKKNDGFFALVTMLDRDHGGIELKQQIFEINEARVGFKHYGNIPHSTEVIGYIANCRQFLIQNSKKIEIDFLSVSLADSVSNDKIRELLKESERFLEDGELEEALTHSSLAYQELEDIARASFNLGFYDLSDIRSSYTAWPRDSEREAERFTSCLSQILESLVDTATYSKFGVPVEEVTRIRNMCYSIKQNSLGDILVRSRRGDHTLESEENIKEINNFIIQAETRI